MNAWEIVERVRACNAELLVDGSRLLVRGRGQPLSDELREALRTHKAEVINVLHPPMPEALGPDPEVAWRVVAMRPQVPAKGPVLLLMARPGITMAPGQCTSCGDALEQGNRFRCELCVWAAWEVLREGHSTEAPQ